MSKIVFMLIFILFLEQCGNYYQNRPEKRFFVRIESTLYIEIVILLFKLA